MTAKRQHHVWIVEDDELFKQSLEELVEDEESLRLIYSVNSVEKARHGFSYQHAPDVILLDIGLPGMTGIEALPIFKAEFPEVSIIMLTIFDDDDRILEAIQSGADGYLLKRTPGAEIRKGIREVLAGGAPISPAIARKVMQMLVNPRPQKADPTLLTKREHTILKHLVSGLTIDMIGEELSISRHTVSTHTKHIYRKLQVHNRSSLAAKAIKKGLI